MTRYNFELCVSIAEPSSGARCCGDRHSRSSWGGGGADCGEGTNFQISLGVTTRVSDVGDPH